MMLAVEDPDDPPSKQSLETSRRPLIVIASWLPIIDFIATSNSHFGYVIYFDIPRVSYYISLAYNRGV